VRRREYQPEPTRNTLLVVLGAGGRVAGHVAVGSAILDADWDGKLSLLPKAREAEDFLDFACHTPRQAEHAMAELAELGDVPFDSRDFEPKWHSPRRGGKAVSWLLAHRHKSRRRLTDRVCAELDLVKRALESAARSGLGFHFVQVEPDEDLGFAGPRWREGPEIKALQLARSAPGSRRARGPRS